MPSLTILLLCWNHEAYLNQAIAALRAQTTRDFDVVFLDNVSSDASPRLAERLLGESGLSFQIIRNETPRSISANLNTMLARAGSDLVAFLSTDDWVAPDYVTTMIAAARDNPEAAWFSCLGWQEFESSGESRPIDPASLAREKPIPQAILDGEVPFFFVGCCYRRSALAAVGGWDEAMTIEDRDMFYRLGRRFDHVALDDRLVHYRMHEGGASRDQRFMIDGWERFFRKHAGDFGARRLRLQRAEMYRRAAAIMIDQGQIRLAGAALANSFRLAPMRGVTFASAAYLLRRGATRLLSRNRHAG